MRIPARIKSDEKITKLSQIGKIKIGEKVEGKSGTYPKSLSYFVAEGQYKQLFDDAFGEKPTRIGLIFYTDDFHESCFERYELRDEQGRLRIQGSGQVFKVWNDGLKDYELFDVNALSEDEVLEKRALMSKMMETDGWKWRRVLTLKFIIPKLPNVMGSWKLDTGGIASSIPNIISVLDSVMEQAGTISHIPMDLNIQMVKSQKPGDKSKFPVLTLVPNFSPESLNELRELTNNGANALDAIREIKKGKKLLGSKD